MVDKLQSELVAKNYRITALEEQLVENSINAGKEISALRTKLFELEIALTGMDDDTTEEEGRLREKISSPRGAKKKKNSPRGRDLNNDDDSSVGSTGPKKSARTKDQNKLPSLPTGSAYDAVVGLRASTPKTVSSEMDQGQKLKETAEHETKPTAEDVRAEHEAKPTVEVDVKLNEDEEAAKLSTVAPITEQIHLTAEEQSVGKPNVEVEQEFAPIASNNTERIST